MTIGSGAYFHTCKVRSSDPLTIRSPSMATDFTQPLWPSSVWRHSPSVFHILMVLSFDPLTIRSPSMATHLHAQLSRIALQRRLGQFNRTVQQFQRFIFLPTPDTVAVQHQRVRRPQLRALFQVFQSKHQAPCLLPTPAFAQMVDAVFQSIRGRFARLLVVPQGLPQNLVAPLSQRFMHSLDPDVAHLLLPFRVHQPVFHTLVKHVQAVVAYGKQHGQCRHC